jgi:Putative lumazine-binding
MICWGRSSAVFASASSLGAKDFRALRRTDATSFGRVWLLTLGAAKSHCADMSKNEHPTEYDAIVKTVQLYVDGSKQGKSEIMRPAFHPNASFFGYAAGQLAVGTEFLFDWIDRNGPAPTIEPRVVSVDILASIAIVRLEVAGWSGRLAGTGVSMSDLFTLLKMPSGWRIIQKAFHWHA